MKKGRKMVVYAAVFSALILMLYLLLVIAAVIPNAALRNNMSMSAKYFVNADRYETSEDGLFRNIADNYADQIWYNIGWNMGFGNPLVSVLDTKYCDVEGFDITSGLHLAVNKGYEANVEYTRYWHGTAALIRMLHLFTDIHGIRQIGMICLVLLILKTVLSLCQKGHWEIGLCLLVSLVWIQFWNLWSSMEYLPSFLICFALCPAFLRMETRGDFDLNVLAVISGTLTAFFDFLTTETVTVLVPLILVFAIRSREHRLRSPKQEMRMILHFCLCWAIAYACTFAAKWLAVSLVTGENHLITAVSSAEKRVNGVISEGQLQKKPGVLMAIGANLSVLFEGTSRTDSRRVIANLTVISLVLIIVYRMNQVRRKLYPGTLILLLLGSTVLLRYGVLANHSYMHAFFTYRALVSTILAVLTAMVVNLRPMKKKGC